jgi:hypothetical protein
MTNKERIKFWKDNKIIAIDPGKNGGIAVFSIDRNMLIEVVKMPETPMDILTFLSFFSKNSICYIEKVGGIPGQGGASSMFNFGKGFGHLEMALLCRKIPTTEVTPQKWQKALQLGTKGHKSTSQWKNKLKAKAQQLYPKVPKITLAISDALLILEYARITEKYK